MCFFDISGRVVNGYNLIYDTLLVAFHQVADRCLNSQSRIQAILQLPRHLVSVQQAIIYISTSSSFVILSNTKLHSELTSSRPKSTGSGHTLAL